MKKKVDMVQTEGSDLGLLDDIGLGAFTDDLMDFAILGGSAVAANIVWNQLVPRVTQLIPVSIPPLAMSVGQIVAGTAVATMLPGQLKLGRMGKQVMQGAGIGLVASGVSGLAQSAGLLGLSQDFLETDDDAVDAFLNAAPVDIEDADDLGISPVEIEDEEGLLGVIG